MWTSKLTLIPGGLICKIQLADVSWNKPFKVAYKSKYNEWRISGEKSYTAAGNVRAPSNLLCLQWVKEAWDTISSEIFKKICGISVKTDGTEDTENRCMKETEVAFGARDSVNKGTKALLKPQPIGDDEVDPFADMDFEGVNWRIMKLCCRPSPCIFNITTCFKQTFPSPPEKEVVQTTAFQSIEPKKHFRDRKDLQGLQNTSNCSDDDAKPLLVKRWCTSFSICAFILIHMCMDVGLG